MSITVIGNTTLDHFYQVPAFPKPGETLVASGRYVDAGGKGLNQAVVASRLGGSVSYFAPIGKDEGARTIRGRLQSEPIGAVHLIATPRPTDESIIFVNPEGENTIVSSCESAKWLGPDLLGDALAALSESDFLLLQGNLSESTTEACLTRAKHQGATTVLNPAPIHFAYDRLWPQVDIAIVNEAEAAELGGRESPISSAHSLIAAGAGLVIVTLGAAGAIAIGGDHRVRAPGKPVDALDTTGAGDAFVGSFVATLDQGRSLKTCLAIAIEVSALTVTRKGTLGAFPTRREMDAIMMDHRR
jgi:ribokinase